jgi:hypothetical protein
MQEKQMITHPVTVEGEWIETCAEEPLIYEDISAITIPVAKRHGYVINPEIRSFLPGMIPQRLAGFTLNSRYQIKAREGILYIKILVSSAPAENPAVSPVPLTIEIIEPDRKRTVYRINASIYILKFSVLVLF